MAEDVIARAQAGDEDAFRRLVESHRHELLLHCYRILGSVHDAEDALQETLLSAWRGLGEFEQRSSVRTWLYRVATNSCLKELRARRRSPRTERPMPDPGLELPEPSRLGEVLWLEPYPDALLEGLIDTGAGPEARYETREAVSLAFVTALQLLPPRQRAVLILRDVLDFHAREVAGILGSTEESITSALKRARATLHRRMRQAGEHEEPPAPSSSVELELSDRFIRAFEAADVEGVVALLTEDVSLTMPPFPLEWQGRELAERFLTGTAMRHAAGLRLLPTRANGQPAFGVYVRDLRAPVLHGVGLMVLTLSGERICAITRFEPSVLAHFGLPPHPLRS